MVPEIIPCGECLILLGGPELGSPYEATPCSEHNRFDILFGHMLSLLKLPENWNSYGARPVDVATARYATVLLMEIVGASSVLPVVVPTIEGGVQFEWHLKTVDLEVEVRSPRVVDVLYENYGTGGGWDEVDLSDLGKLRTMIASMGFHTKVRGVGEHQRKEELS